MLACLHAFPASESYDEDAASANSGLNRIMYRQNDPKHVVCGRTGDTRIVLY
jgi:hypothetical protein